VEYQKFGPVKATSIMKEKQQIEINGNNYQLVQKEDHFIVRKEREPLIKLKKEQKLQGFVSKLKDNINAS
jgi:hypothetical protein